MAELGRAGAAQRLPPHQRRAPFRGLLVGFVLGRIPESLRSIGVSEGPGANGPPGHLAHVAVGEDVDAFIKKSSFLHYTEEALDAYGKYIIDMAEQEQLEAHANAARVRMKNGKKD